MKEAFAERSFVNALMVVELRRLLDAETEKRRWHHPSNGELPEENVTVAVYIEYRSSFGDRKNGYDFAILTDDRWGFLHPQFRETTVIAWQYFSGAMETTRKKP